MAARNPGAGNGDAVLGAATKVTGRIQGAGSLRIEGHLVGDAHVGGALEVPDGGRVDGNIDAESVEIAGALAGDVNSAGPVAFRAGSSARGSVRCERVVIEPGARVAVRVESDFEIARPARADAGRSEVGRGRRR
jgi:cytoskeletal protein CcmA (bactofilin family)